MDDAEANTADPDVVSYIEAPTTWTSIGMANPWQPYDVVPNQPMTGLYTKDGFSVQKGEVVHTVKTFFHKIAPTILQLQVHKKYC